MLIEGNGPQVDRRGKDARVPVRPCCEDPLGVAKGAGWGIALFIMISLLPSEVAAYYAIRIPDLLQRGKRWRGPCEIHKGQRNNFSVDPATGLWQCWSCGRRGDVITLELTLTGASFPQARNAVFALIGRPGVVSTHAERRAAAIQRKRKDAEFEPAEYWRHARLSHVRAQLETEKVRLLDSFFEDQSAREMVFKLTSEEILLRRVAGAGLITRYQCAVTADPEGTRAVVRRSEEMECANHLFVAQIINLLSRSPAEAA